MRIPGRLFRFSSFAARGRSGSWRSPPPGEGPEIGAPRLAAYKLPPGRHGLSREHVADNQRWRLLGAATELLAENGYRGLTTREVATRAAVSSRAFYVHFHGLDDCLRAAFEVAADVVGESAEMEAAIERLARDPWLAVLFGLEARAAVPGIAARSAALVESLAPEPRACLLLGAGLTLLADRPAGQGAVSAERAAEITALVARLGGGRARDELSSL